MGIHGDPIFTFSHLADHNSKQKHIYKKTLQENTPCLPSSTRPRKPSAATRSTTPTPQPPTRPHHHENVPANTTHNTTGTLHSTTDTAAAPTGDAHNLVGGSLNPMGTYAEPTHDPRGDNAHSHVTVDTEPPRNDHALGRESMPTETTKTGPVHHNEKLNKL